MFDQASLLCKIFDNATLAPIAVPSSDMVATAKIDFEKGEVIDELGEYM